jgi:hypothetical protein
MLIAARTRIRWRRRLSRSSGSVIAQRTRAAILRKLLSPERAGVMDAIRSRLTRCAANMASEVNRRSDQERPICRPARRFSRLMRE